MTTDIGNLISAKQVSCLIGVHIRTLQRWAKEKDYGPPFIKIGNRNRYYPDGLDEWITRLGGRPPDARA